MQIFIKDSGKEETLALYDTKTGIDYINDFIGNEGALRDGQFVYDDDRNTYVCNQDTFDWWEKVVDDNQDLNDRIFDLVQKHGYEKVFDAHDNALNVCLENYAASANACLDEAFGSVDEA